MITKQSDDGNVITIQTSLTERLDSHRNAQQHPETSAFYSKGGGDPLTILHEKARLIYSFGAQPVDHDVAGRLEAPSISP